MEKRVTRTLVMATLVVLSGCNMDVKPEVYVSDLRAIASGNESQLQTPTTIAIEIPSSNDCDEYTEKIGKMMIGILDDYEFRGCTDEGMDSHLNLAMEIPLLVGNADASIAGFAQTDALFYVSAVRLGSGPLEGNTAIVIGLHQDKYSLLNERMNSEFMGSIDLADSMIQITLNNDEREPVDYWVQDVFVDREPIQTRRKQSLRRRGSVDIVLSNVGSALLESASVAYVATLGV